MNIRSQSQSPFCLVFRVGGTANFRWLRSLGMTEEEGLSSLADMVKGGHVAYLTTIRASYALGVPDTFGPDDDVDMYVSRTV